MIFHWLRADSHAKIPREVKGEGKKINESNTYQTENRSHTRCFNRRVLIEEIDSSIKEIIKKKPNKRNLVPPRAMKRCGSLNPEAGVAHRNWPHGHGGSCLVRAGITQG